MSLFWHAVKEAMMSPVVASVVVGVIGFVTAKAVTSKIEKTKLDAQKTLELERMEFQKEAELQKQRMELYKTLYAERIVATRSLAECSYRISRKKSDSWHPNPSSHVKTDPDLLVLFDEFFSVYNANSWLFDSRVKSAVRAFARQVDTGAESEIFAECRKQLEEALSAMMFNGDLERLIT